MQLLHGSFEEVQCLGCKAVFSREYIDRQLRKLNPDVKDDPDPKNVAVLAAADEQAQSGVDLGGAGAGQQDLVQAPLGVHRDQAALVDDGHHRHRGPGGAQQAAEAARGGQVGPRIDDRDVRRSGLEQRRHLGGRRAQIVRQQ